MVRILNSPWTPPERSGGPPAGAPGSHRRAGGAARAIGGGWILLGFLLASPPAAAAATVTLTITLTGTVPGGNVGVFPLDLVCSRSPLPGTCAFPIESGTAVTLSANSLPPASPAGIFSAGSGSAAGCGASTCSFTITTDSALTATFDPALGPFATLTVTLSGSGKGEVDVGNFNCDNTDPAEVSFCSSRFAPGSLVTLEAEAGPGSVFAGYSGACVGSAGICAFRIGADSAVTAAFNQQAAPVTGATVEAVSGTVTVRTPLKSRPLAAGGEVASGSVIQTGGDGAATVTFPGGRQLTIAADTLVSVFRSATDEIVVGQIRGALAHRVTPPSPPYRVRTPVATIRLTGTDFSTEYTESGASGELVVSVQEGTVEVVDRRQQLTVLATGARATVRDAVPRPTPILPVDGAAVLEGRPVTFTWTAFAAAAAYLLEYTLEAAGFAGSNPPGVQSPGNVLPLPPGAFLEAGGVVEIGVVIPPGLVPRGTAPRWRVFAADGGGQPLAGTTSSDASSLEVLPNRVAQVRPADGEEVAGGATVTFGWTSHPGAAAYLFEFTLNPAGFAVPNAPAAESPARTLPVMPGALTESAGVVAFPLLVPPGVAPPGTRAQWRVFPLDATGQVLTNSTASDARTVVLQ